MSPKRFSTCCLSSLQLSSGVFLNMVQTGVPSTMGASWRRWHASKSTTEKRGERPLSARSQRSQNPARSCYAGILPTLDKGVKAYVSSRCTLMGRPAATSSKLSSCLRGYTSSRTLRKSSMLSPCSLAVRLLHLLWRPSSLCSLASLSA